MLGRGCRQILAAMGTALSALGLAANPIEPSPRIVLDPVCASMPDPNPPLPPGNPAPGTRKMAALLQKIYAELSPEKAVFFSDRIATNLAAQASAATDSRRRYLLLYKLAVQQIASAKPDEALNNFSAMEAILRENRGRIDDRTRMELRLRKASAYFRLGEQENCLVTDAAEACIFPLSSNAVHKLPRGSRNAIQLFREHLAEDPRDLAARWLLNLAHMTLGEYPDKVDPAFVIPPSFFASEHPMPRFPDVAAAAGLACNDLSGGTIVDDFDNDGFYDIVFSAWDPKGQLRFFRNKGDGMFAERTSEAGLVGMVGALNIQQTDYNNDGHLDIWMMRGAWLGTGGRFPNSLLRNNGDGTFADVTEEAGLLSFHPTQTAAWFDFDGDGWLDVFIGNESTDPKDPDWSELYRNNGNGTFTECARSSGIEVAEWVKGVACGDFDNDGRPDLYLSMRAGKNRLYRNEGPVGESGAKGQRPWRFSDVAAKAGPVDEPFFSFGTFFFDYDNDGWQDLLVFGYHLPNALGDLAADYLKLPHEGSRARLYRNLGNGTFGDASKEAGLDRVIYAMGHNFGDLDNDGFLDFYAGTGDPDMRMLAPNRMFRNSGGKVFQDVTTDTGTGHLQKGHAVSFADLDNDGDQDIYTSIGGAFSGDYGRNALFLNPGASNQWLKLKLTGVKANRAAIGARIALEIETKAGLRTIHRVVNSGGSFGSNPLRQEFGLADAVKIVKADILWPGSAKVQTIRGLGLNQAYEVREGDSELRQVAVRLVPLGSGAKAKLRAGR